MIRQARTYLVSAMSGAGLIAIAIAVFVVLVSTQVFRDWPLAALGNKPDESATVSSARPAGGSGGVQAPVETTTQGARGGAPTSPATGGGSEKGGGGRGSGLQESAPAVTQAPSGESGEAGNGKGGGGSGGSGGGGNSQNPAPAPESTGSTSSSTGTAKGGGGESGGGSTPPPSASATVTETVNGTVNQVDETVLGGALEKSGVTNVTEGVVNGVAGPESLVGRTLDETTRAVEGLLKPPAN